MNLTRYAVIKYDMLRKPSCRIVAGVDAPLEEPVFLELTSIVTWYWCKVEGDIAYMWHMGFWTLIPRTCLWSLP